MATGRSGHVAPLGAVLPTNTRQRAARGGRAGRPARRYGVFELASLALTGPDRHGDVHGDVEAVRWANTEDPHGKIHDGPRAVTPAMA